MSPADLYHYPVAAPEGVFASNASVWTASMCTGASNIISTPDTRCISTAALSVTRPTRASPLRGLDPRTNYTAEVKTVWEDGKESPPGRNSQAKFTMAVARPAEMSLTQIEPSRSNARWRGFEIDERLSGAPLSLGGKRYEKGLAAVANSEIEFDLKGLYDKFTALVGVDDGAGADQGLEFIVTRRRQGTLAQRFRAEIRRTEADQCGHRGRPQTRAAR